MFCLTAILIFCSAMNNQDVQLLLNELNLTGVEPQVERRIHSLMMEVKNKPDSARAWGYLAMNLDVHDFKRESIPCYKNAAELDPQDFRWTYYCAIALYEAGSPDAIPFFERTCRLKPKYAPAHLRHGYALFDANKLEDARQRFRIAGSLSPTFPHAHLALARVALAQGKLDESYTSVLEAIRKNPEYGEAHAFAAEIYRRREDLTNAKKELIRAQQLSTKTPPDDPLLADLLEQGISSFWYEWRGRSYLKQGAINEAIQQLKLAAQASPESRLYDTLGIALQYAGKYREAAEQHRAALRLNPKSAGTMNNLAAALAGSKQFDEALLLVQQAIAAEPAFTYSYLHLSSIYLSRGKRAEAIAVLRKGCSIVPAAEDLILRLGWLLATVSDPLLRNGSEAIRLVEPLCRKTENADADCLDVLAAAYAETGVYKKAVELAVTARDLAISANRSEFAGRIASRLQLYGKNKAYHD